jgi:alpha-amylase/alpha-mannosidase (GH57 family)
MKLAFCWHMHQPYYRDEIHGEYRLPWVYLHAMKDYSDMAWHLEQNPDIRLTVNFAPVLLEQLTDYATQIDEFIHHGAPMNDNMLNLLAGAVPVPKSGIERNRIILDCQRCNRATMIEPWPAFKRLVNYADTLTRKATTNMAALGYFSKQYFYDLLTWYHLTWLGHGLKQDPRAKRLLAKGSHFTDEDRGELLELIHECLRDIIPRYRKLAERGQIELSMTPWGHPIVPLLHDFDNMECAQPDDPRPKSRGYPGGKQRTRWHMQHGIELFESCFGIRPQGVWLSEGSISHDALELLDEFEIKWTASGENVWQNSARLSEDISEDEINSKRGLFRSYVHDDTNTHLFFRDDGLSDLIGFEYRNWATEDAVANFSMHISNIEKFLGDEADDCIISVIMDGENAWEYFPDNAFHFIDRLYHEIASNEAIEPVTFTEAVEQLPATSMEAICPGSWVYGTFSTWIGSKEKNRAWDLLIEAKRCYDHTMSRDELDEERAAQITRQMGICEASDWFWWFGDYNSAESVRDFDELFRRQLRMLYQLLGLLPPSSLDIPISRGSQHTQAESGTMRRNI